MLNFMRRFASSFLGKLLGGLLLIGLAGFGISNVLLDLGSNTMMKIGSDEVSVQDFQRAYQGQLNQFAQRTGQMPTNEQALQLGIPTNVLLQLGSQASLDDFAKRLGLGVSDAQLAKALRSDPNFAGTIGSFDRGVFQRVLQQNGLTEAQYFDTEARQARREQLSIGLFAGLAVPKAAEDLLNRYRNDTRTVEYFSLNSTSIPSAPAPTDADLTKYLADHQADFRTKETRQTEVLALTPEVLGTLPAYQPSDDEIKAEYERTKASLTRPEKRVIQQVVLSDPAKAEIITAQQAAGASFADAIAAAGLTTTNFGLLAKSEVQDQALADAAFGLAKVGDFVIIPGIAGRRAIGVTQIDAGGTTSYDDAKAAIAKQLAVQKAKNAYSDIQDQIEELRAAFKPLKEIGDRFKVPVVDVALTADGAELSAVSGIAEADRARVTTAVFAATAGKLAPTVSISSTNNVWFDLSKVDPARDETLDEVRDAVTTAWTDAETEKALAATVKDILAELDSGKSFQDVAAERNQFATVSRPITRNGDGTTVLNQQVATQIFSAGANSHGSAVDGDGDHVVYHVVDVTPATGEADANIKGFLTTSITNGLYNEFINGVTDEIWPPSARQGAYTRMLTQLLPAQ
jgi:peptidyl-prolyl cis-trans isomerase D